MVCLSTLLLKMWRRCSLWSPPGRESRNRCPRAGSPSRPVRPISWGFRICVFAILILDLDVRLKRLGHVVVDDSADVRLVDPHFEGHGGHDDPQPARHGLRLHLQPGLVIPHIKARQPTFFLRWPVMPAW